MEIDIVTAFIASEDDYLVHERQHIFLYMTVWQSFNTLSDNPNIEVMFCLQRNIGWFYSQR